MENKERLDPQLGASDGGLKEIVLKWFTETQASFILHNGNFPDWFQGFTARKNAEDQLNEKTLGCFLIRLSDKAIGYILSYKGRDRCRHFVINQNEAGLFIISGDSQTHRRLTGLIEHYKVCPIQPFGEYLTSSCHKISTGSLYDVVNFETKVKPGTSVQALRCLWDHRSDMSNENQNDQHDDSLTPKLPVLPPKSNNRKHTDTSFVGRKSFSQQSVPTELQRGMPFSYLLNGSFHNKSCSHSQTQNTHSEQNIVERLTSTYSLNQVKLNQRRKEDSSIKTETSPRVDLKSNATVSSVMYSELDLTDNRNRPLPTKDNNLEGEYSKKVTCHTYSLQDNRESFRKLTFSDHHSVSHEELRHNPLYQTTGDHLEGGDQSKTQKSPSQFDPSWNCKLPTQQVDCMYAEVSQEPNRFCNHLADNTYEQIPGDAGMKTQQATDIQGNTYETVNDLKTKSKSTWGKKNVIWRKFHPEFRKK